MEAFFGITVNLALIYMKSSKCTLVSGTKMIVNIVPDGNKAMFIKIICLVFLSGNMCTETCSPYIYEVSLYKDLRFFESVFVIEKTEVYRSYYF